MPALSKSNSLVPVFKVEVGRPRAPGRAPEIRYFRLPADVSRRGLEKFGELLSGRVMRGKTFGCLITTDAAMRGLNRQFRKKDYATDVLSFPADGALDGYAGDLAISWQQARVQAREFGHAVATEIQILMLHGVLHLSGMDHEADRGEMSRAEKRWRRELGLPAGLIERVSA